MNFADPKVAAVYAEYEARIAAEKPEIDAAFGSPPLPRAPPIDPNRFLLPVGPEVGRFLHALILARRPRRVLELGTSYGYSILFLADAAREVGAHVVTIDLADYKQAYAAERIAAAGLTNQVEFRLGDAVARSQRLVDGPDEVHRWTVGRNVIKAYREHGTTASAAGGDLI